MSVDDHVFRSLMDMGIGSVLARAAAVRFTHPEAAVNWCFGDGQNWTPEQDEAVTIPKVARPVPPTPDFAKAGTTVEHHEVASHTSDNSARSPPNIKSPPLPSRPQQLALSPPPAPHQPITFGDKNPFRNSDTTSAATTSASTNPFHQPIVTDLTGNGDEDEDEDEDLKRALAMSFDPTGDVDPPGYDEGRPDRERSVRATAPPPSPTEKRTEFAGQEDEVSRAQSPFGPREEGATGNSLALMPGSMHDRAPTRTKEEEDMEKAIADSLMTASFHSNASAPVELNQPDQVPRIGATPMVLYSESGKAPATAHLLQAIIAVPRMRALAENLQAVPFEQSVMNLIWEVVKRDKFSTDSFMGIDEVAMEMYGNLSKHNELPPLDRVREAWEAILHDAEDQYSNASPETLYKWSMSGQASPPQLFRSELSHLRKNAAFVTFYRDASTSDIHAGMANALWADDSPNSIHETSDVLVVMIAWNQNGKRELWKLDQKIVIDRYMTKNVAWAMNIRAKTGVAKGNARRWKEKIDRLTTHDSHSIEASLKSVIKHYETTPGRDEMQQEQRREMKEKLEQTLAQLQTKVAELESERESEIAAAEGGLFETDDPWYNQHVYRLVAVLYHDGALMGQGHLYMYLLGSEDQWWKIQDHRATPVDWSVVASDSTGLYMDGGPYTLVYDRESPRKEPYGSELEWQRLAGATQVNQDTPRPPARTQGDGHHSPEGEAQHIEHLPSPPQHLIHLPSPPRENAPLIDLLGDELPAPPLPTQPPPPPASRPLPPVPTRPPTASEQVESNQEGTDEDITMS